MTAECATRLLCVLGTCHDAHPPRPADAGSVAPSHRDGGPAEPDALTASMPDADLIADAGAVAADALTDAGTECHDRDCPSGGYCHDQRCVPRPTLVITSVEGTRCLDLGQSYVPPDYLWRRLVSGRPGATATQHNLHISCPTSIDVLSDPLPLGTTGVFEERAPETPASTDCDSLYLGRWEVWVEVDQRPSARSEVVYFNSNCPQIETCATAADYCTQ